MGFPCSLSDSKSTKVSRTLLSIFSDLDNAVVWMVFPCPLISKSSSHFTSPLGIVPSTPITTGITVTFMFHSFFSSRARSIYLSLFTVSFYFTLWSTETAGSIFFFVLLTLTRSGFLAEIRWSVCISKSQRTLCVSFSRTDSGLYIFYLFAWSNLNFLHNSQWITFLTQSCLVLYSFRLLCDWSFRLYHYICYFVASYLFLL